VVRRVLLGLVAGAIAGIGLRLTWRPFVPAKCATSEGFDCAFTTVSTLPVFMAGWMAVVGVLLRWALRESPDVWDVIEVSCSLWALLSVLAWLAGVLPTVETVLPVLAYPVAGVLTGLARPGERSRT
jgi:hypothetical protein